MTGMEDDQGGPTLVSTGSSGGWKLPALVVVALLSGLVAVTRLGGPHGPAPVPPSGLAAGPTLTTLATPTAEPTRAPIRAGYLMGVIRRSAAGQTCADGIATGISSQPVYRVRDSLLVPLGRTMAVSHLASCAK